MNTVNRTATPAATPYLNTTELGAMTLGALRLSAP